MFEKNQTRHQANRQLGTSASAGSGADHDRRRAEHVSNIEALTSALLALELGGQHRLDLLPRQPSGEHRQRVVQVDHGVDAGAEKIRRLHAQIPRKKTPHTMLLEGNGARRLPRFARDGAGSRRFAGPTK